MSCNIFFPNLKFILMNFVFLMCLLKLKHILCWSYNNFTFLLILSLNEIPLKLILILVWINYIHFLIKLSYKFIIFFYCIHQHFETFKNKLNSLNLILNINKYKLDILNFNKLSLIYWLLELCTTTYIHMISNSKIKIISTN